MLGLTLDDGRGSRARVDVVLAGPALIFSTSEGVMLDVATISPATRWITHGTALEPFDR